MSRCHSILVVAFWLLGPGLATAQTPAVMPDHPRYVLPTTPAVAVILKDENLGKPLRGKWMSLTSREAIIDTGNLPRRDRERGERGQRIALERIESLRSIDGRFEFRAGEEFNEVSRRMTAAYISVVVDEDPDWKTTQSDPGDHTDSSNVKPRAISVADPERIRPGKAVVNGLGNGGFGGLNTLSKPKVLSPEATPASIPAEPEVVVTPPTVPVEVAQEAGVTEILTCSRCAREIPASAVKTGFCPHCKIAFTDDFAAAKGPAQSSFQQSRSDAFTSTSTTPIPAVNSGTQVVQGGGISLNAIPTWAKAGLFVLLALLGYHLLYNR